MYKIIIYSLMILLFAACGAKPQEADYSQGRITKLANSQEIEDAFTNSQKISETHSKWFNKTEKLELTIIGPVYRNPIEKSSIAFKKMSSFLSKMAKDPTILDKLSGLNISSKYSKIKHIPFKLASKEDAEFTSIYESRLKNKSYLSTMLRKLDNSGNDKASQTLAIWINPEDLKSNIYTLEGFKTVKSSLKDRNSAYYNLSKQNSNGKNNEDIIHAIISALQIEIPEYIAIDRKKMLKEDEEFRVITDNNDGSATGKVYKYNIQVEIEKLIKEKDKTQDSRKLLEIDQQIKSVRSSKQWREYETKQILYTEPINQETINVLYKNSYISKAYIFDKLTPSQAKEINLSLKNSLPDTLLMTQLNIYNNTLNTLGISIGSIEKTGKGFHFRGKANYNAEIQSKIASKALNLQLDSSELFTEFTYTVMDYAGFWGVLNLPKDFNYNLALTIDNVDEPIPETKLYGTYGSSMKESGLKILYTDHINGISHSPKTWSWTAGVATRNILYSLGISKDKSVIYWLDGNDIILKDSKTYEDITTIENINNEVRYLYVSSKNKKVLAVTDHDELLMYDYNGVLVNKVKFRDFNFLTRFLSRPMIHTSKLDDEYSIIVTKGNIFNDEKTFFINTKDGTVINANGVDINEEEITVGKPHPHAIVYALDDGKSFLYSPDDAPNQCYLRKNDGTNKLVIDAENGREIHTLWSNDEKVVGVLENTDETNIFKRAANTAQSKYTTLHFFDKDTTEKIDEIKIDGIVMNQGTCDYALGYCLLSEYAFIGFSKLHLYNIKDKEIQATIDSLGNVSNIEFVKDNYVVVNTDESKAFLFRLKDMKLIKDFNEHNGVIGRMVAGEDIAVTQSADGSVKVWELGIVDFIDKEYVSQ
ncbi:hypothetical protein N9A28_07315 [Sulfurimonas sp.]|nr:hypothetical protein [Sulfurimonas sp.]